MHDDDDGIGRRFLTAFAYIFAAWIAAIVLIVAGHHIVTRVVP